MFITFANLAKKVRTTPVTHCRGTVGSAAFLCVGFFCRSSCGVSGLLCIVLAGLCWLSPLLTGPFPTLCCPPLRWEASPVGCIIQDLLLAALHLCSAHGRLCLEVRKWEKRIAEFFVLLPSCFGDAYLSLAVASPCEELQLLLAASPAWL